ncbi:MAG: Uma2 family endonuclease [Bryobacteraceae bacterium]
MSTQAKTFLTPEEYLAIERKAEYKSQYYRGEMFAMAGASLAHNTLVANSIGELHGKLRGGACRVLPSDMRVRVSATGLYTYPDVVAVCGEPRLLDNQLDTLLNPHLIVEVLSLSTEAYDRGRKFEHYQTIESLREYLLLATDRVRADLYTRQPDGRWLLTSATRLEDSLDLQSVGCSLSLAGLYERVDLAEPESTAAESRP